MLVLAGCAREIWISTTGPPSTDWPPESIVLEIGDDAWTLDPGLGGGTVVVSSGAAITARVLWADDCTEIVSFAAEPGERYQIRFDVQGRATAQPVESTELGPGLGEAQESPCR